MKKSYYYFNFSDRNDPSSHGWNTVFASSQEEAEEAAAEKVASFGSKYQVNEGSVRAMSTEKTMDLYRESAYLLR